MCLSRIERVVICLLMVSKNLKIQLMDRILIMYYKVAFKLGLCLFYLKLVPSEPVLEQAKGIAV